MVRFRLVVLLFWSGPALRSYAFGIRCSYSAGPLFKGCFGLPVGSEYFGPRQGNAFELTQKVPLFSPAGGSCTGVRLMCKPYGAKLLRSWGPV